MIVTLHAALLCVEFLGITPQQQQIGHTQEGEVNECILGLLLRETLGDDVGYGTDAVAVLDGGSDGHRTGTLAYIGFTVYTLFILPVDVLAMVRGDVDEFRIEFLQPVDRTEHLPDTVSLERGSSSNEKAVCCVLSISSEIFMMVVCWFSTYSHTLKMARIKSMPLA